MTLFSAPRSYEERLVDLAAQRVLPKSVYKAAGGDPDRQAQLLDAASDKELAFELQLVSEKYGLAGTRVVEQFAADVQFQEVLRAYGDGVAPVIVYFMDNDLRSLRALAWVKDKLGRSGDTPYGKYGPVDRGRYAIGVIARTGHHFLGQFAIDTSGKAHWNQTDRSMQVLIDFLAGGLRNIETKHDLGEEIGVLDALAASADIFVPIASVKALKLFKAARVAGVFPIATGAQQAAARTSLALRTRFLGAQVLQTTRTGRAAMKLGLVASTSYLVIRHPGLLNSFFEAAGRALGVPVWMAKFVGWALITLPLLMLIGPLLMAVAILSPVIRGFIALGRALTPGLPGRRFRRATGANPFLASNGLDAIRKA